MRLFRVVVAFCAALVALVPGTAEAADSYPVLTVSLPASVPGGAAIPVAGTLADDAGRPIRDVEVELSTACSDHEDETSAMVGVNHAGEFSTSFPTGNCSGYQVAVSFPSAASPVVQQGGFIRVVRVATSLTLAVPDSAFTSDPILMSVGYRHDDDQMPIPGVPVIVHWYSNVGSGSETATTGADGSASLSITFDQIGEYEVWAETYGTTTLDRADTGTPIRYLLVTRRPVSLTLSGPPTAGLDQSFNLTGSINGPPLPANLEVSGPGGFATTVTTQDDGAFQVPVTPVVRGGDWTVTFERTPLYERASKTLAVQTSGASTWIDATAPASTVWGESAVIVGTLHGVEGAAKVHVGSNEVSTAADGTFSISIGSPAFPGNVAATVIYDGDPRHEPSAKTLSVHYSKVPTTIQFAPVGTVVAGSAFRISGKVNGFLDLSRHLVVTAPGGNEAHTTVSPDGTFSVPISTWHDDLGIQTYRVTWDGGLVSAPVTYRLPVLQKAHPLLRTKPTRPRAIVRGIRIYRMGDDPVFTTNQQPNLPNTCHRYRVQRVVAGHWRTIRTSACMPVRQAIATSQWRWVVSPRRGVTYRVFAEVAADQRLFAGRSAPRYFRFR